MEKVTEKKWTIWEMACAIKIFSDLRTMLARQPGSYIGLVHEDTLMPLEILALGSITPKSSEADK